MSVEASGSAFIASADLDAGVYSGEDDKYGVELGVGAGAYSLKGEYTPSVTIFGVKIGVTVGGSIGSAHIGGRTAALFNSKSKEFELTSKAHIGLGVGVKIGFEITNTKQKIYGSRKRKKK